MSIYPISLVYLLQPLFSLLANNNPYICTILESEALKLLLICLLSAVINDWMQFVELERYYGEVSIALCFHDPVSIGLLLLTNFFFVLIFMIEYSYYDLYKEFIPTHYWVYLGAIPKFIADTCFSFNLSIIDWPWSLVLIILSRCFLTYAVLDLLVKIISKLLKKK